MEEQLREFKSAAADDEEVESLFSEHAVEVRDHRESLGRRLAEMGEESQTDSETSSLRELTPPITATGHRIEERLLQNLLVSYTLEAGCRAYSEVLFSMAAAANDEPTERLAQQAREEERRTAEKTLHLIPSRSKIAFNMLTVDEVDPAIETKLADDRVIGS